MVSRREPQTNEDINENKMTTWNDMRAAHNGVFIVDLVLLCVDKNGFVPHRLDALAERFTLPQYLIDTHIDDVPFPLLIS